MESDYVNSPKIIINQNQNTNKKNNYIYNNLNLLERKKRLFSEMESLCDKNEFLKMNEMFEKKFKFCS